jgi:hypothetical protein
MAIHPARIMPLQQLTDEHNAREALLRARLLEAARHNPHGLRRAVQRAAFRWLLGKAREALLRGYAHARSMLARKVLHAASAH